MRYSQLFPKTLREAPKDAVTANHKYLVRGGFIDQLMAGSWTLMPLGWRVATKIMQIVREEMNAVDSQEMLMPLLHPKEIWNETGRWDSAKDVMYQLSDSREREFALSFTHEEIIMDLVRKHLTSYKELPLSLYHFSTKFRNEMRATAGILRGREFLMKDMYSFHQSESDLMEYYERVKTAYLKAYKRLGLDAKVVAASGGVFTENLTHEFQVITDAGEDTIYYCDSCDWAQNKEIFTLSEGDKCPECSGKIVAGKSIEVGNIFPFGDKKYAEKMGAYFTDKNGDKRLLNFGSYGIGITRAIGAVVEVSHDARGIIWPKAIAPFHVHLVGLKDATDIYKTLVDAGIEVLYDDTDRAPGPKFADADLIGIPVRLVVSDKAGDKIEFKLRTSQESELLTIDEVLQKIAK